MHIQKRRGGDIEMTTTNDKGQTILTILEEDKKWIDKATYEQMFYQHRFAPSYHRYFTGDTGIYFRATMKKKAGLLTYAETVAVSKKIGWQK